ncbi:DUF6529 family protein [Pedococcus sp. 5OH_020]|uniref:DUF6529 family protein n=1 Tax=Pedococcus sp. 5OH_020 TaxID=2989814 RepID=UPI0022EA04B2|nr:DUF6529 family protein [Pedococcus sp. 5OH_020]
MASPVPRGMAAPVRTGLAGVLLLGAGVSVALGVYAAAHEPSSRPLVTLGFSGMLQMKTWLATGALALVVLQLVTALWMWQRLPGAGPAPGWVGPVHRWSGSVAFLLTLPVAFHCLWALGLGSMTPRVMLHSVAGCLFYGAYAAKMLGLRLDGLPSLAVPVLGGLVLGSLVAVWASAALWFFSRSGLPVF